MATTTRAARDPGILIDEWLGDIRPIIDQMEGWLRRHSAKPEVVRREIVIEEPGLPKYTAPALTAEFQAEFPESITVDPVGRNYPGRGRIDIVEWPLLRRVYLLSTDEPQRWAIYTESRIPLHQEWTADNFLRLVDDLRADV